MGYRPADRRLAGVVDFIDLLERRPVDTLKTHIKTVQEELMYWIAKVVDGAGQDTS
jgi:hypothetical protein